MSSPYPRPSQRELPVMPVVQERLLFETLLPATSCGQSMFLWRVPGKQGVACGHHAHLIGASSGNAQANCYPITARCKLHALQIAWCELDPAGSAWGPGSHTARFCLRPEAPLTAVGMSSCPGSLAVCRNVTAGIIMQCSSAPAHSQEAASDKEKRVGRWS